MNPAHTDTHASPELEQLEADGGDRCIGKLGFASRDAAQGVDQDAGDRRKPQSPLIDAIVSAEPRSAHGTNCSPMRFFGLTARAMGALELALKRTSISA
jgi:hypothetical protein